jgi:hypothetical protein
MAANRRGPRRRDDSQPAPANHNSRRREHAFTEVAMKTAEEVACGPGKWQDRIKLLQSLLPEYSRRSLTCLLYRAKRGTQWERQEACRKRQYQLREAERRKAELAGVA